MSSRYRLWRARVQARGTSTGTVCGSGQSGESVQSGADNADEETPPWKSVASELLAALTEADLQRRDAAVRVMRALIENVRARP